MPESAAIEPVVGTIDPKAGKSETAIAQGFLFAAAPLPPTTPNLNAALVKAIKETKWVEYTKPGSGISYEYLAEEDIVKELRVSLPSNGLTVVPVKMTVVANETYSSNKGGRMVNRLILVRYRVSHVSGEFIEGEAMGEGSDHGDKAINKAMTGAFKYFLRELTLLAGGMDPDRTSSDDVARAAKTTAAATGKPAQQSGQKAQPSKQAEKPLAERCDAALKHIAGQKTHKDIHDAYVKAKDIFKGDGGLLKKVQAACANRATVLYLGELSAAADFETVDGILKRAEKDQVGADNLAKLKDTAEKRNAEIGAASGGGGYDDDNGGEPEPIDF